MNKLILKLAIPNILTNLSIPLLSCVDLILTGHLKGTHFLGAITLGAVIFNSIYWAFIFIRMGTTGLTAQSFGKNKEKECFLVLHRSVWVAGIIGVMLVIFQNAIVYLSFLFAEGSQEMIRHAKIYFHIRIWDAPATLGLYALHGWFLGMQNAIIPLIITIGLNILNIVLNIVFVKYFHMTSDGIALGTVISQYTGLIFSFIFYRKYFHTRNIKITLKEICQWKELTAYFNINKDIFIRTLCLIFTFYFFTVQSSKEGDVLLAANGILLQLWLIYAYALDGFATAAESLVGRFIGEQNIQSLKKAITYIFRWGIGFGCLFFILYGLFGRQILSIFTNQINVLQTAQTFLYWTVFGCLINGISYILDGIFTGATATKPMRNSMILCTLCVYLPVYYLSKPFLGQHSFWLTMTAFIIARILTLSFFFKEHILNIPFFEKDKNLLKKA